jgi:hypothetical protein
MMDLYMKNGRRSDAYTEFLAPIMGQRENLVVRKYAFVLRLLFDESGANSHLNIVRGVEYQRHGKIFRAWAKKEVCAYFVLTNLLRKCAKFNVVGYPICWKFK